MSDLLVAADKKLYFVTVTQSGTVSVTPRVSVINVTNKDGQKRPEWARTREVAWMGDIPYIAPVLSMPDAHADACILVVGWSGSEQWLLSVPCIADYQVGQIRLTHMHEVGSLLITVCADCGGPDRGNSVTKTFEVCRHQADEPWEIRQQD
jgi:hypothetical protein